MKQFSIQEIATHVSGTLKGNDAINITGIEEISVAQADQLTFIGNSKYAKKWADSNASAALVSKGVEVDVEDRTIIEVDSADLAVALVLELFAPEPPKAVGGVHATAVVDESAELGAGVSVGAGSYIGPSVKIGDGCVLHANVTVMDDAEIGEGSVLWPGSVIRERCSLGAGCIIHINVAIGADGFGYRASLDGKSIVKIPQIGNVVIGNGVEIGANSCVDRGKFSSTRIGDLVKIDNLCQIGHNCDIGPGTVIASSTAIAGSVTVGMFCQIGGCVAIVDHATIGNQVKIGGGSGVIGDIADGETVLGYPAGPAKATVQQWAYMKKLPQLAKKLKDS